MSIQNEAIAMFPHTATIYHHDAENDTYTRTIVSGVYWYGPHSVGQNGKGRDSSYGTAVVIPMKTMNQAQATVEPEDIMIKGEGPEITSIADLEGKGNVITVQSTDWNDVGSLLDCVVINGV